MKKITQLLLVVMVVMGGFIAPTTAANAAVLGSSMGAGQTLSATDQLVAQDGSHRLVMQADGNAVVYTASGRPAWSSNTFVRNSRLVVQTDGNAVIYTPDNRPVWNSGTAGRSTSRLVMQNDGNLVLYGTDNRATWSTRTGVIAPPPPPPPPGPTVIGTVLNSGQRLGSNQALAVGGWRGVMQRDGNFVIYANGRAQFNTRTGGNPGATLLMQSDGNAVVYSTGNRPLWNSGTVGNPNSRMVLQNDGNLVVYRADGSPSWSRTTGRIAAPPPTVSQQNAERTARSYLEFTSFSRTGLIDQLEYEGFSTSDATWAVDRVAPDWNEQAALKAKSYLEYTSFSRAGLIRQLEYEGFTTEQAEYGVSQTGL